MGFGEAIKSGFNNYATFQGRASRSEFWWWTLFAFLVNMATSILEAFINSGGVMRDFNAINLISTLALLLPGIAVTVRRLHDTDHSGWWYFIPLTIIGIIPFFIWICSRGTPGANRFGLGPMSNIAGVFGDGTPGYAGAPASFDRSRV